MVICRNDPESAICSGMRFILILCVHLILNVNDALDLSKIDLDQHVNLRLFHKKEKMLLWPY